MGRMVVWSLRTAKNTPGHLVIILPDLLLNLKAARGLFEKNYGRSWPGEGVMKPYGGRIDAKKSSSRKVKCR